MFKNLLINLQGSWLNGANLRKARLQGAILTGAYLQKANLFCVRMQGAYLKRARLQGADLMGASLQVTNLKDANLQGAILRDVKLQVTLLSGVRLQGAYLSFVYLQEATLSGAKLQGAGDQRWTSFTPFACRIRKSINKESDVSRLVSGGIGQGGVDLLCEDLSDDNKKKVIRESLRQHIGKPVSYGLPEDSGADIGTYTKEEAEEWITEYEEAMSEFPKDDS